MNQLILQHSMHQGQKQTPFHGYSIAQQLTFSDDFGLQFALVISACESLSHTQRDTAPLCLAQGARRGGPSITRYCVDGVGGAVGSLQLGGTLQQWGL